MAEPSALPSPPSPVDPTDLPFPPSPVDPFRPQFPSSPVDLSVRPFPPSPVHSNRARSSSASPMNNFLRTQSAALLPRRRHAPAPLPEETTIIPPIPEAAELTMNSRHSHESAAPDEADAASSGSGSRASPLSSSSRFRLNPSSSFSRRQPLATTNRNIQHNINDQDRKHYIVPSSPAPQSPSRLRTASSFYNSRTQARAPNSYRGAARRIYRNPSFARTPHNNTNHGPSLLDDVASLAGDDDDTGSITGSVLRRRATLDSSSAARSFFEHSSSSSRVPDARNNRYYNSSRQKTARAPQILDPSLPRRMLSADATRPPTQSHSRSFYNNSTSSNASRLQATSSFHHGPRNLESSSGSTIFTYAPRADSGNINNGSPRRLFSSRRGGAASSSIDSGDVSFERALPPLLPRRGSLERINGGARRSAASDIRHGADSVKAQISSLFVGNANVNASSSNGHRAPMARQFPEHAFRRRASVCASSSGNNPARHRNLFGRGRRAGAPTTNTDTSFSMGSPAAAALHSRDVALDLQSIADEHVEDYECDYDYSPVTAATGVH